MSCSTTICFDALLIILLALCIQAGLAQTSTLHPISASPELINQLTKQLSITPAQATGGAGTLFALVKGRLSPEDFSKIAGVVPGMGGLLKAAPSSDNGSGVASLSALAGGSRGYGLSSGIISQTGAITGDDGEIRSYSQ